jgi:anti-sigma regulatory factor (Ser/Thr protein kinase)
MNAFHHEAVFYDDREQYLAGTLPDIRQALAGDGAVLVAVGEDKRALLQEALGADADAVAFADMLELGRNPACIIPAWRDFLREAGPGPIVGIGEPVWPGRSDAELVECSRHESLLNLAFDGGRPWRLLCPYDSVHLTPDVLAEACRNHPHLGYEGATEQSGSYDSSHAVLTREDALPAPTGPAAELLFGRHDLSLVREFVGLQGRRAGFDGDRLEDLVLAANELATNSMRHAGGSGILRTWQDDDTFCCEVRDRGRIDDPLAGREYPTDQRGGGRGLWIVNHLCDLVQMRSSASGSVVRLSMTLT